MNDYSFVIEYDRLIDGILKEILVFAIYLGVPHDRAVIFCFQYFVFNRRSVLNFFLPL